MTQLTLFTLPPSPHNIKIRLALKLKGLEYKTVAVQGFEGREEIVKVSGQPLTPVLQDGDKVIYDSFGIIRYLDANYPEPRIFSADRETQQAIQGWEKFALNDLGSALGLVAGQAFSGQVNDDATKQAQEILKAQVLKVEEALKDSDYLLGDTITAADLTVVPFLKYPAADHSGYPEGTPFRFVAERLSIDPAHTKTLAWIERVLALDAVASA
ncbi:MAG: glutathione S-transferase family protein [Planctomycetota bacterium]|nr:glutathione S-transferase family protein [Planctomycetota bacterium]